MATIHISDIDFQHCLKAAIDRAIETRQIQGGKFSPTILGKIVSPRPVVGVAFPPITLGIIYRPNADLC